MDDLPRALSFYRDVLGFTPMTSDPVRFQSFDSGAGRVLLLFKRGGTLMPTSTAGGIIPPQNGVGPHHVGFAIAAAADEVWLTKLVAHGLVIESEGQWPRGGRSRYFRDPNGNLLEVVKPGIWPIY